MKKTIFGSCKLAREKFRKFAPIMLLAVAMVFAAGCTKSDDPNGDTPPDAPSDDQLWTERARQITEGCATDYDKAKALYEWECANIAYDLDLKIYTAEECWNQRKGVCQAYCELFVELASHCGLQAVLIQGDARTLSYPNGDVRHAWVKANTEKGWILIDPTWGAGYTTVNGFIFYENKNMSWFNVDPELLIFTHYPDNTSNQMLNPMVTKSQYSELPLVEPAVSQAGWIGHDVLDYFLNHLGEPAPLFYLSFMECVDDFQLVEMPYCGNMRIGETYVLKVLSRGGGIVISNPHLNWQQETVEDGVLYQVVFQPQSEGDFVVFLNNNGIMKYNVIVSESSI